MPARFKNPNMEPYKWEVECHFGFQSLGGQPLFEGGAHFEYWDGIILKKGAFTIHVSKPFTAKVFHSDTSPGLIFRWMGNVKSIFLRETNYGSIEEFQTAVDDCACCGGGGGGLPPVGDNGDVLTVSGGAWVSAPPSGGGGGIVIQGIYLNDADAAADGVSIGEWYELGLGNSMGLPDGLPKKRTT